MKLSPNTLTVLKNFASINENLLVDAGSTIKTINEDKTILGTATVAERFERSFGIHNLNQLLSLVGMFNDPELELNEDHILLSSGGRQCKYWFSEPSVLTSVTKDLSLPEIDIEVEVTQTDLNELTKAASIIGSSKIQMKSDGKENTTISVNDDDSQIGNSYMVRLDHKTDRVFDIKFAISNLKLIPGDYKVSISSKFISKWESKSTSLAIHYFVAVDKGSTFNV
jgi:hypothetical protein